MRWFRIGMFCAAFLLFALPVWALLHAWDQHFNLGIGFTYSDGLSVVSLYVVLKFLGESLDYITKETSNQ